MDEEIVWTGSFSGQFLTLANGGQNTKQPGATKTLMECLNNGLTTLSITFDRESSVWYQFFTPGTSGWHKLGEGNTNGRVLTLDLSSFVNTISSENGFIFQGGDYGNIIKITAHK